ncbi:MAG TPA: hypothetical protein VHI10_12130 [Mycobacterium sp.]|nr:hypothetical protein [Mycobacterium sp.]
MLAAGLLMGGSCIGTAVAEPGDANAGGGESSSSGGDVGTAAEGGGGGGGNKPDDDRPTSTVGNGREDDDDRKPPTRDDDNEKPGDLDSPPKPKFKPSFSIPILRIPTYEEFAAPGWTPPSAYITTFDIPIPTLEDFFRALSQPEPQPTPGPAFRTQEEAPVADATGGGGDHVAAGSEPPVFKAPLVVPPTIPLPAARPAPLRAAPAAAPAPTAGVQPAVAGVRTPLIRGSLPPSVAPPNSLTPLSGQSTRVGYPRSLRSPTVGELAAVALPGVGGLMFLTFSGGVIGYRQANSVRFIRTQDAARFLP